MIRSHMSDGSRVSIVTANLNQGDYLEQALTSVLDQGYPDLEYIVIDGGSTDQSVDIIRRYSNRLAFWTSEPDRGQSHAINKGLARATGAIVGWLNADDLYLPGSLARVASTFAANADLGLLYGNCWIRDEASGLSRAWSGFRPAGLETLLAEANGIPQPSAFVRRSVLVRTGVLDESMHLAMDYDLWLRVYKHASVRSIDEPLSLIRDHPRTKTRRDAPGFVFEFIRALDQFYAGSDVPPAAWRVRSRAYARLYYAAAANVAVGEGKPLSAAPWLGRALRYDPRLVLRIPRALCRLARPEQKRHRQPTQ
jgi:GT2 family glycosyltransferase